MVVSVPNFAPQFPRQHRADAPANTRALCVRPSAELAKEATAPITEQVARWSHLASTWGFVDFLSPEDGFKDCLRSNRPWANRGQSGIYFWVAENGEAYVGQSVAPQSRLRQHWREHRDIAQACFLPCAVSDLDRVEEQMIREAGKHFELRNIKHSVSTAREVPFDKLVHVHERDRFIAGGNLKDANWRSLEILARIQERKCAKFLTVSGAPEALATARTFISRAIPKPAATELGFWSITLFPASGFIRVNAGQQEVFTCQAGLQGGRIRVLTDRRVSVMRSRKARYRVESYITALPAESLDGWLQGEVLLSCRRLVVQLMRHTTALNSGSHCPQAVRVGTTSPVGGRCENS